MTDEMERSEKRRSRRDARLVIVALAGVLLLWFVIANTQKVKVHFWVFSAETSLITVIVISAGLGALLALLLRRSKHPRDHRR
jgi:uncharacterized integral membrane protein